MAWLGLAMIYSWLLGVGAVWGTIEFWIGMTTEDVSFLMAAAYIFWFLLVAVLPTAVASNGLLAQRFTGLPRWTRIVSMALALLNMGALLSLVSFYVVRSV